MSAPHDQYVRQRTPSLTSLTTRADINDDNILEAGRLAKLQVTVEMKEADENMKKLLEKIAEAAVRNGDDREVMTKWENKWIELWDKSVKTPYAFRMYEGARSRVGHPQAVTLSDLPDHLKDHPAVKALQMTRKSRNRFNKETKIVNGFEPEKMSIGIRAAWLDDIRNTLHDFDVAVRHSAQWARIHRDHRFADPPTEVGQWLERLTRTMEYYYKGPFSKAVAGMQVKYETARLVALINGLDSIEPIPLLTSHEISACYRIEEVLERVKAWTVGASHSLSKPFIGRRAAAIYGLPHLENSNQQDSF
ncbi:hypothetical protein JCM16303_005781 [Sporobolomyces ruberrimus]